MLDTRSVLRSGLIVCIAGIVGLAVSVTATAGEGGFPLAFATPGSVQSGSNVQSASGVMKTLYRLALKKYENANAEALVAAVARLIESGMPPGIILQISRRLLSELTAVELIEMLEKIARRIAGGEPPGQVVTDILERGNGKGEGKVRRGHGNNSEGDARGRGNNAEDGASESGNGTSTGNDSDGNSGGDTSD